MSEPKKMTLRVQSSEGTARVEVSEQSPTAALYERVHEALQLSSFAFALHRDRARKDEVVSSKSRTLRDLGLRHGDMLYLSPVNGAVLFDQQPTTSAEANNKPFGEPVKAVKSTGSNSSLTGQNSRATRANLPEEDEVDILLYQMDGKIQRQRDEKLCRHNSNGCCVHCSPLEPWDENYLKEHNIKHMSFHSYLRKITSGKFVSLEELSCKIKPGCKEHPPWPRGICSACQPGAVTLMRQLYRHTDNVVLEHGAIHHPDVPLGIRARVAAIYEPPQTASRDHVTLAPDPHQPLLDAIAKRLGLRPVGWIFTDLLVQDRAKGTVKHIRGVDTHFLSAQECLTAAHYQNLHRNACRHAPTGYFGSKFVTVCVTGDKTEQVSLEGYQVSGQCAALARDGVLLPTRDAPELAHIRASTDQQYVPDVYYKVSTNLRV
ncbi:NPL4 family domain-containing protein [Phthorimaea operculella]|nr:NPL4 family domain-containing protein [Phthorimaea operculella]